MSGVSSAGKVMSIQMAAIWLVDFTLELALSELKQSSSGKMQLLLQQTSKAKKTSNQIARQRLVVQEDRTDCVATAQWQQLDNKSAILGLLNVLYSHEEFACYQCIHCIFVCKRAHLH